MTDIAARQSTARPFANALADTVGGWPLEAQEASQTALERLANVGAAPESLSAALRPNLGAGAVAEALLADARIDHHEHPELARLALDLIASKALACLPQVSALSRARLDAAQNIQEVVAYLPDPDDAELKARLDHEFALAKPALILALARGTGKAIRMREERDPSLIMGARIHVGDQTHELSGSLLLGRLGASLRAGC